MCLGKDFTDFKLIKHNYIGDKQFIEFIVKDVPSFQKTIRDGLIWIDVYCKNTFNNNTFIESNEDEQKKLLNSIAFPESDKTKEEIFFSTFRDLVVTGYFTSKVGIKDLEYKVYQNI